MLNKSRHNWYVLTSNVDHCPRPKTAHLCVQKRAEILYEKHFHKNPKTENFKICKSEASVTMAEHKDYAGPNGEIFESQRSRSFPFSKLEVSYKSVFLMLTSVDLFLFISG